MTGEDLPQPSAGFDLAPNGWDSDSKRWNKYPPGVLPLWVADMDFAVAAPIRQAMVARVQSAPFWYAGATAEHNHQVATYLQRRYAWKIEPDWVLWVPGVMAGIYQAVQLLPEDAAVICQTPVYGPLTRAAKLRHLLAVPLYLPGDYWHCNWPDTTASNAQMLLLCHPHNPTGKVMIREELRQLGSYAAHNRLLVVSDEIHADLTLDGEHLPFALACPELLESTITFMAASKTYNIAGLNTAVAIIPDPQLRQALAQRMLYCGEVSNLGRIATLAAFAEGESWRQELLTYLRGNRAELDRAITSIDGLDWIPNQATYLGWINCSALAAADSLHTRLLAAGLALSSGSEFGDAGHLRINCATSRERLRQALQILARVCN